MGEALREHNAGRAPDAGRGRVGITLTRALAVAALAALAACSSNDRGERASAPGPSRTQTASPAGPQPGEGGRVSLSGPARVALLAPLTAPDAGAAAAARDIEDAARLAIAEGAGDVVALDVRDTAGDAATAASAAQAAAAAGDALIVGPLYGANADAVGRAVESAGLNVIAFSNTPSAGGGNVWVAGLLASSETDRILSHAAQQGWRGVGLYYPETPLGRVARAAAEQSASRHGVALSPVMAYPRSFEGIQDSSQAFDASFEGSGAATVLLPDEGQGLQAAASFMRYHGIGMRTPILGMGGMADPELQRDSSLSNALYAGPDPVAMSDFAARFQAAYGRAPGRFAWLGYDAVAAAAQMMRAGRASGDDRPFGLEEITDPGGFRGVAGPWRLTRDGLNMRALAVLTPSPSGPQVVSPATIPGAPGS
ncbi:penicillin-binding protein activator [Albimonas pacifica]|uniref:Amino acid/amide ABC transporter substrate-binding protein, HAAT family n=1 Tax=Albimonas pacifica TaxID=1114924 RepID=A0A1I3FHC4_9RHOB|nr:penicillin-binding protein activator [Albimonas pacifica]SFI10623.1 amino acid/amide ABC transporter substrate-binding protein, HAAT family [Albimonas pacifica]